MKHLCLHFLSFFVVVLKNMTSWYVYKVGGWSLLLSPPLMHSAIFYKGIRVANSEGAVLNV